jgi:hypothetical protein
MYGGERPVLPRSVGKTPSEPTVHVPLVMARFDHGSVPLFVMNFQFFTKEGSGVARISKDVINSRDAIGLSAPPPEAVNELTSWLSDQW